MIMVIMSSALIWGAPIASVALAVTVPPGYSWEVYSDNVPNPIGLAMDSTGLLYVGNDEIRPGRARRIPVGGGAPVLFGPTVDDPDNISIDGANNVYIGSEDGLYRVTPAGVSTLFASTYLGNMTCQVRDHTGRFGEAGAIYAGNASYTHDLVRVSSMGTVSPFVTGSPITTPFGLAIDDAGYLYVTETGTAKGLYRVTPTGTVTAFVSTFTNPFSVVWSDWTRRLYVGDVNQQKIFEVTQDGQVTEFVTEVSPHGMAFGSDGQLYVSDRISNPDRILRISGFAAPPVPAVGTWGLIALILAMGALLLRPVRK